MSANKSRFFPSLYDESNACGEIWASNFLNHNQCNAQKPQQQTQHEPRQHQQVLDKEQWPDTGILFTTKYQPLEVFSPPTGRRTSIRRSEMDQVNEVAILMKELELGAQLGEHLDRGRYYFLKNLHASIIQKLREDRFKSGRKT